MERERETRTLVIDIISEKIEEIINARFDQPNELIYNKRPSFIISRLLPGDDSSAWYLLTLIVNDKPKWIDYRQSAIITLNTDLENLIESLYNRTT